MVHVTVIDVLVEFGVFFTQLKGSAHSATTGSSSGDSGKSKSEGQHTNVSKEDKSPVMDKDGMCH